MCAFAFPWISKKTVVVLLILFIYLQEVSSDYLQLLSRNQSTSQSSTYFFGYSPLAVDGIYEQRLEPIPGKGYSCTHTLGNDPSWWQVNLSKPFHVHQVKIWNRGDFWGERLAPFSVQVLSAISGEWIICDNFTGPSVNGAVYTLVCKNGKTVLSKAVKVALLRVEHLSLCEVEVWGSDHVQTVFQADQGPQIPSIGFSDRLADYPSLSLVDCSVRCSQDSRCQSFGFNEAGRKCELFQQNGGFYKKI